MEKMMEISKSDWKLFRERIGEWQERHMEWLNQEYISLLSQDKPASVKFWELEKRIRKDRNTPGVQLELRKSEISWDLAHLINCKVIDFPDLEGFSPELIEVVHHFVGR